MKNNCKIFTLLFLFSTILSVDLYSQNKQQVPIRDDSNSVADSVTLTINSSAGGGLTYKGESIVNTKISKKIKKGERIILGVNPQKGYKLEKLSVNGVLRDVVNNTCSLEILTKSYVKVVFSAIQNVNTNVAKKETLEKKPKFVMCVTGPGRAILSGEISGIISGTPANREEFYVTNGGDVTISLDPVKNIKSFTIGLKDKTANVISSNGFHTIGVTHAFPEYGVTSASVEFIQRHNVDISTNAYGKYTVSSFLKKNSTSNNDLIDEGYKGQVRFTANEHCHLEKLLVNGTDMTSNVKTTSTDASGPSYEFDLGSVEQDYKIVATFAPDPKLTISCGQNGYADRTLHINSATGYIHHLDPDYKVNSGQTKTFYEPSAAKSSNFYGKEWILRTIANEGYELLRLIVNGVDMTSRVIRNIPDGLRYNKEICFLQLGFINNDTKVQISFKEKALSVKQQQQIEWVDLGTGVKWATRNVGANKVCDVGNYYSWKEASALKVPQGRLPTYNEIMRLIEDCHPEFTQQNGVKGIRFYHKSDRSVSIFIPAAGFYPQYGDSNTLDGYTEEGAIWTSTQSGAAQKIGSAIKERSMDPIWLMIGDFFSPTGYDRAGLAFNVKEKIVKSLNIDIGARISVRLVKDR